MADDIHPDMTLRDWLAFNATEQDIKEHTNRVEKSTSPFADLVPDCTREQARYRYADAMLEARKGGSGDG